MRHQLFAWPGTAMPRYFLPVLILCLGCRGQTNEKNTAVPLATDSVPPPQQRAYQPPTHRYGEYLLKYKPSMDRFEGEVRNDSIAYYMEEKIPGIVIHQRSPANYDKYPLVTQNMTLIEYYDTTTRKLKKRLDLEKLTPYNSHTYKNISIGSLDYEGMDIYGPDSNCIWPDLPKLTHYYTNNWIHSISPNGYICVGFELIKMAKTNNTVVGWEQTIMVLDAQGKDVMRIPLAHSVWYPCVTDNRKFLYFVNNKGRHNTPEDACKDALHIYDLLQKKRVYYREFDNYKNIGILDPEQMGGEIIMPIGSIDRIKPEKLYEIIIMKPNLRELRTYHFSPDEGERYLKMKPFQAKRDYLNQKTFTTTKF